MRRSAWNNDGIQLLFGIWVRFAYLLTSTALLPIACIAQLFAPQEDRSRLWRLLAKKNAVWFLRIAGIRLDLRSSVPQTGGPVIYASNHPSWMDGVVNLALVGPEITSLVAPFKSFPFPLNVWLKQCGAVDIERDEYDHMKYPGAHQKEVALQELINALNRENRSVLIFPEGHIERLHKLHYIHTGVARVSIRSKRPIVPISLVGMEAITPDPIRMRPGRLIVRFGTPLIPPVVTSDNPYRHAVKTFTKSIQTAFLNLLPLNELPEYLYEHTHETIAAFFDIDNTLYKGYAQQDFLKYLVRNKLLEKKRVRKIFTWLFLEKIGVLTHEQMMTLALRIMSGSAEHDVEVEAKRFFESEVIPHLEHNTLSQIIDHQKEGHVIVLLTEIIEPLAKQFERYFKATTTLCTQLETKRGVYTGKVNRLCWNKGKKHALDEFVDHFAINRDRSFFYADSYSDIPALEAVGNPIAVNADSKLLAFATANNWEVLR